MTHEPRGGDRAFARFRASDISYGSESHQRAFIDRLDECQRRVWCANEADDHEHSFRCYPDDVVRSVCGEAAVLETHREAPIEVEIAESRTKTKRGP